MGTVFFKLLNMSLTSCWLILAVVLARVILKKAPKYIRYFLWAMVAIRLICPISVESKTSLIPVNDGSTHQDIAVKIPDTEPIREYEDNDGLKFVIYDNGSRKEIFKLSMYEPVGDQVLENRKSVDVLSICGYIWLIGVIIIGAFSIFSYKNLKNRVGTSAYIWDRIWISDEVETPFILGIRNPRIYLPSSMDEEVGNQVIAHEQAHIKRKDYFWKPFGFVVATIHWFNPLVWLAYALYSRDIELICDEMVIKSFSEEEKKLYSKALVFCSVPHRIISACPIAFGESGIKSRIKAVLGYKKPTFWIVLSSFILLIVVGICFLPDPAERLVFDENTYAVSEYGNVTIDEFDEAYVRYIKEGYSESAAERAARKECYSQMVEYQLALWEGYSVTDDEIAVYIDGVKESFTIGNGQERLAELVKRYGSEDAYYEFIERTAEKKLLIDKFYAHFDERSHIDFNHMYDENNFDVIKENHKKYMESMPKVYYESDLEYIDFESYLFKVNSSMPEYVAHAYYSVNNESSEFKEIVIKDKNSGVTIQRIETELYEYYRPELIYFADVNSDGYMDILAPMGSYGESVFCTVYLYDAMQGQFVYDESYDYVNMKEVVDNAVE